MTFTHQNVTITIEGPAQVEVDEHGVRVVVAQEPILGLPWPKERDPALWKYGYPWAPQGPPLVKP